MFAKEKIQAILFDSGRVLNQPRSGHWFVPPNFQQYVNLEHFNLIDKALVQQAFSKAYQYLETIPVVLTEAEEYQLFKEFYRIFAAELPSLELTKDQIDGLAQDNVFNDQKFHFPKDVFAIIPHLSQSYPLGVVSDTWPSLERVFQNAGLRQHFSVFIMSSVLGISKPDQRMFQAALDGLNALPENTLFIDDNLPNLQSAHQLGLQTIWMQRDAKDARSDEFLVIHDLVELQAMLI